MQDYETVQDELWVCYDAEGGVLDFETVRDELRVYYDAVRGVPDDPTAEVRAFTKSYMCTLVDHRNQLTKNAACFKDRHVELARVVGLPLSEIIEWVGWHIQNLAKAFAMGDRTATACVDRLTEGKHALETMRETQAVLTRRLENVNAWLLCVNDVAQRAEENGPTWALEGPAEAMLDKQINPGVIEEYQQIKQFQSVVFEAWDVVDWLLTNESRVEELSFV